MGLSISIFGLGYVGSVTAACFADMGHRVVGVDVDPSKVEMIEAGKSPIIELGMDELVGKGRRTCHLHATTDVKAAVRGSDVSFICVGTPSHRSGKLDLAHVEAVCRQIGTALREKKAFHLVVLRSTVLPGSTEKVAIPALESASGLRAGRDFGICYNPEFIREGSAVADFLQPPYTIFGANGPDSLSLLHQIYRGIPGTTFATTIAVSEMVKYVSNVFHALKVGFANEIGTLCKSLEVDTESVTRIFTSDTKLNISPSYLSPGFAFGGSCLPKDLRALSYCAKELDLKLPLLDSIENSNGEHVNRAVDAVLRTEKRNIALLGLSFKAGTDDLRESPQVQLVKRLLGEGCQVRVWDQDVSLGRLVGSNRRYIETVIPHIGSLLSADLESVIRSAEVVIVGTKSVQKDQLNAFITAQQTIIDFVNLDSSQRPQDMAAYEGICW